MNNIGESIHKLVVDTGVLPTLVKIVKKKVLLLHLLFLYALLNLRVVKLLNFSFVWLGTLF